MQHKTIELDGDFSGVTLSYLDRGDPGTPPPVVCIHGLTRNARDFDTLAEALAGRGRRVLAVDVAGRGGSSWLPDPSQYDVKVYARHLRRFLELLGLKEVDWVGTSMGGLIGIEIASSEKSPIRRFVLNDIGPFVPQQALAMIRAYLGLDLRFEDIAELEAHLRYIHAGFGQLSDAEWRHMAVTSSRETEEGLRLHYDPLIREPFAEAAEHDIDMWRQWDRITCPTFVLHGADSPLLTRETIEEMKRRGPEPEVVSLPGVGHAPALNTQEQIGIVARWLGL
ncbi:alpha/beta fold hydrolase [Benzoatithermus flavus]|uniref:Alpha/beta hydrolase n=1 Tax=Benzoatithermus flavus TaxID=3108223 RepID=A0ABU8XSI0_9PROT